MDGFNQHIRIGCWLLCSWLLAGTVAAQRTWSTTELLQWVTSDSSQTYQTQLQFLETEKLTLPWVRKLEFRTETDEFRGERQEYSVRLSVNGKKARRAQEAINNQLSEVYRLRQQELSDEKLVEYCDQLADWYYTARLINLYKAQEAVLKDKRLVINRMIAAGESTDVDDVLQVERALQRLQVRLIRLERQAEIFASYLLPADAKGNLNTENWIAAPTMQSIVGRNGKINPTHVAHLRQLSDVRIAELELELENAEGQQFLDFLSLKYAGRDKLGFGREISLGASFNIPLKSNNRVNRNEAALELLDETTQYEQQANELEAKLRRLQADFDVALAAFLALETEVKEGRLQALFDNYAAEGTAHPLELLEIKDFIIRQKIDLLELHEAVFGYFFEILTLQNLISVRTGIDFMANELPKFTELE